MSYSAKPLIEEEEHLNSFATIAQALVNVNKLSIHVAH